MTSYRISLNPDRMWHAVELTDGKETWFSSAQTSRKGAKHAVHLRRKSLRPAAAIPSPVVMVTTVAEGNYGGTIVPMPIVQPRPGNTGRFVYSDWYEHQQQQRDLGAEYVARIAELEAELGRIRERARIEIENYLITAHFLALAGKGESPEACSARGTYFVYYDFLDEEGKAWARELYSSLEKQREELVKAGEWAQASVDGIHHP